MVRKSQKRIFPLSISIRSASYTTVFSFCKMTLFIIFIYLLSFFFAHEEKIQCTPCKALIDKAMKYIESYGIEMFKNVIISQYCNKLPHSAQGLCKKVVETQARKIAVWIDNQLQPEEICEALV